MWAIYFILIIDMQLKRLLDELTKSFSIIVHFDFRKFPFFVILLVIFMIYIYINILHICLNNYLTFIPFFGTMIFWFIAIFKENFKEQNATMGDSLYCSTKKSDGRKWPQYISVILKFINHQQIFSYLKYIPY